MIPILIATWVACGVTSWGLIYAHFQHHLGDDQVAREVAYDDRWWMWCIATALSLAAGPFALASTLMTTKLDFRYGFQFWPSSENPYDE